MGRHFNTPAVALRTSGSLDNMKKRIKLAERALERGAIPKNGAVRKFLDKAYIIHDNSESWQGVRLSLKDKVVIAERIASDMIENMEMLEQVCFRPHYPPSRLIKAWTRREEEVYEVIRDAEEALATKALAAKVQFTDEVKAGVHRELSPASITMISDHYKFMVQQIVKKYERRGAGLNIGINVSSGEKVEILKNMTAKETAQSMLRQAERISLMGSHEDIVDGEVEE